MPILVDTLDLLCTSAEMYRGRIGDKLVLDRKGPGNSVRMRVELAPLSEDDPFSGLRAAPPVPRPTTIIQEMREMRASAYPVQDILVKVLAYLTERFGDAVEIDERRLSNRLESYMHETKSWRDRDVPDVQAIAERVANELAR